MTTTAVAASNLKKGINDKKTAPLRRFFSCEKELRKDYSCAITKRWVLPLPILTK